MLKELCVRHLAVVDDIELSFSKGMTSLTGETGAGKSILVDALSLVLGDRADSTMIRQGHDRAEIEANFDTKQNDDLHQWLIENELEDDYQCHLRRTISRDGRSRAYINGRVVPVSLLRSISERTIDIHGQHAHQSLLRTDTQRTLLDTVAHVKPFLEQLKKAYQHWQMLDRRLTELKQQSHDQSARLDLLKYQVNELEVVTLSDEHIQNLINDQRQLAHAAELIHVAESALHQLFDQEHGSAYDLISHVLVSIEKCHTIEPRFAGLIEHLNGVIIQLDDCGRELRHYQEGIEINPIQLEDVEHQLAFLHQLARKHHIEIEQLPDHYQQLVEELSILSQLDVHTAELQQQLTEQEEICRNLCQKISELRQQTALPLAQKITATLHRLAISGNVEFIIEKMPNQQFNDTGFDQIQLVVSTNPGQKAGPLNKVASGGELSRISLAIQVVTAGVRSVPTLVFDEVDVGIGGGIAEIVGQHLRQLATTQQVICITHLPQVAAQAHQQLQVSKKQVDDSTHIELTELNHSQRIEEIARMLGGIRLTEKTRSHAQEMLEQSQP